jgi:hypothetical protein
VLIGADRWRSNWRVTSPPGAVEVPVPRSAARRRRLASTIRELPAGTPVVVLTPAPRAARRSRAFATKAGVHLEREYLAFPSAAAPGFLIEDAPATVRAFVDSFLVAPPRSRLSAAIDAALGLLRAVRPYRLIRALAPGRVVIGRRL